METRAHYVAVGTFVILIVCAVVGAVLWLGHVEFGRDLQTYYVFFRGSVAGLTRGSAVQYNGIPVGRVIDIRVDRDNLSQIQVTLEINTNLVEIKDDARAYLETNILSGASTVQIRGGTQQAKLLESSPGHRYAIIKAGQSELEEFKSSLPELVGDLKQASHNLNSLLDERNRQAVADSLQNLRTLTAAFADHSQDVGVILDHTNTAILQLNSLLQNVDHSYTMRGGLKDQASQTLKDYDRVATNLIQTARQLQLVIAENRPGLRNFVQTTLPGVDDLVNDVQRLADNLNQFVVQLQRDPTRLLFGDRRQGYQPR
ncbi:MAG: MCE family protein [Alphaproteobacteria bacterium]|nr:MCE family protein [Alphaproteobacteria bacterium]